MAIQSDHDTNGRDENRRSGDVGDNGRDTPRVAALGSIGNFEVADGTPDPRGWTVVDSRGTKVGKVHDLIVDTVAMRTRYLDVKLDSDAVGVDRDRDVLIPVGQARLDDDDDHIILGSMVASQLGSLPEYDHQSFNRDYETSLLPNFDAGAVDATDGGDSGAAIGAMNADLGAPAPEEAPPENRYTNDNFYATPHFDDSRFLRRQRADSNQGSAQADDGLAGR